MKAIVILAGDRLGGQTVCGALTLKGNVPNFIKQKCGQNVLSVEVLPSNRFCLERLKMKTKSFWFVVEKLTK